MASSSARKLLFIQFLLLVALLTASLRPNRAYAETPSIPLVLQESEILTGNQQTIDFKTAQKGTVLLFLSTACPCTNGSLGEVRSLAKIYQAKGFHFFGLNLDDKADLASLQAYYKAARLGFPIVRDKGLQIARSFQIRFMAEAIIVLPDRRLAYRGGIKTENDDFLLLNALKELADGQNVSRPQGEGLGCFLMYPEDEKSEK